MNTLQRKMKTIGSVYVQNWKTIPKLVSIMGSVTIIESRWADTFKRKYPEMYPLNLSDIKTWSTYETCVSLEFEWLNTKFIECNATIFDGSFFSGNREKIRFMATLHIPISFLNEIKEYIESDFEHYCECQYEEHLANMKKEWIDNFKENLLV